MKTDEDLTRAFSAGDNLAFAALYSRYKQPVYVFALRMLSEPDSARDAFQAAFLKAFECRSELVRVIRFKSWIFTVARNLCLNELRRSKSLIHRTRKWTISREKTLARSWNGRRRACC